MSKKPWQSKTLWLNLIAAVSAMVFPQVQAYIASHPETVALVFSGLNMLLRLVTKEPIQLS